MDSNEIIKKVRKIEIKTKGLSKHIFSGEYQSAFKGRGMSFSEVREYSYGDDVRNIDWNVTARTGDAHIKVFEEERELTIMFLVDISKSSFFGSTGQFKSEYITEICAVIGFSALNNNDKVGAILFSDKVEKYLPPKKGRKHILRIIRELIDTKSTTNGTDINVALKYLNNVIKKKSITFLLSDFHAKSFDDSLRIAGRKHDLIGLHVYDQNERELPNVGLLKIKDAETERTLTVDTGSKKVREQYRDWFDNNVSQFKNSFNRIGLDLLSLCTNEDYIKVLLKFFKKRVR